MVYLRKLIFGLLLLGISTCTKPVDFDQLENAHIQSTYIFTLVYFEMNSSAFLTDQNAEVLVIDDSFELPIKGRSEEYLEKVQFTVVTENSFARSFTFQIVFFDNGGQVIYTLEPQVTVAANSEETTHVLEIPKQDLNKIYNTESVGFELVMSPSLDGSQLSANDPYIFKLKSSITFFVNLEEL